jgi:hypothetical protein
MRHKDLHQGWISDNCKLLTVKTYNEIQSNNKKGRRANASDSDFIKKCLSEKPTQVRIYLQKNNATSSGGKFTFFYEIVAETTKSAE